MYALFRSRTTPCPAKSCASCRHNGHRNVFARGTLEGIIGTYQERDGMFFLPLPHPAGVSRWLNDPAHQQLLQKALAILATWRRDI